jgi:hypothetical protein
MEARLAEMEKALRDLVEQFHAYENGWLGENIWRYRIGLPDDLKRAESILTPPAPPEGSRKP